MCVSAIFKHCIKCCSYDLLVSFMSTVCDTRHAFYRLKNKKTNTSADFNQKLISGLVHFQCGLKKAWKIIEKAGKRETWNHYSPSELLTCHEPLKKEEEGVRKPWNTVPFQVVILCHSRTERNVLSFLQILQKTLWWGQEWSMKSREFELLVKSLETLLF